VSKINNSRLLEGHYINDSKVSKAPASKSTGTAGKS